MPKVLLWSIPLEGAFTHTPCWGFNKLREHGLRGLLHLAPRVREPLAVPIKLDESLTLLG